MKRANVRFSLNFGIMLFMDRSLIIFYVSKFCFDGGTSNKLMSVCVVVFFCFFLYKCSFVYIIFIFLKKGLILLFYMFPCNYCPFLSRLFFFVVCLWCICLVIIVKIDWLIEAYSPDFCTKRLKFYCKET